MPNYLGIIFLGFLCVLSEARAANLPDFRLGLSTQIVATSIELTPRADAGNENRLEYRPASSNYAGVILGYRWLGGTVSFSIPAEREIRAEEGTSRYRDYRLSLYFRRFGIEAGYNRFLGYLIDNSSSLSASTLNGEKYYKVQDLETLGFGTNFFYVVNPDPYSLSAAFDQGDIQEKSAGSALIIATWRWQSIDNSSALIPTEKQANFGTDALIRYARSLSIAGGVGYAYNWIFLGRFFFAPMGALSLGAQQVRYGVESDEKRKTSIATNFHARIALGYNHPNFFTTITAYIDRFSQPTESIEIANLIWGTTFSIGARF